MHFPCICISIYVTAISFLIHFPLFVYSCLLFRQKNEPWLVVYAFGDKCNKQHRIDDEHIFAEQMTLNCSHKRSLFRFMSMQIEEQKKLQYFVK